MKTMLFDIAMTILVVTLSSAFFFQLGRIIEGRQGQTREELTEREIQDLTEMRVMREWELQAEKEGK
jgi:hypothetical protein